MNYNIKDIEYLLEGEFKGSELMWQMFKMNTWIISSFVIGIILIILFFVAFRITNTPITFSPMFIISGVTVLIIFMGGMFIKELNQSSKYIGYLELDEIDSKYKEKRYQLTFSSEIKNVKIAENGNLEVKTSEGLTITIEKDKVTAEDIGKKLILQRSGYEPEKMSINFGINDYLTEVSVQ